jgi:hypothetical protein
VKRKDLIEKSEEETNEVTESSEDEITDKEDDQDEDVLGPKVEDAISKKGVPGPSDLSQLLSDSLSQPILCVYPKHRIGDAERRFNSKWYTLYNWLEYSAVDDAVFCFHCRHFSDIAKQDAFTITGFRAWNRATGNDPKQNSLLGHQHSEEHLASVEKFVSFKGTVHSMHMSSLVS